MSIETRILRIQKPHRGVMFKGYLSDMTPRWGFYSL